MGSCYPPTLFVMSFKPSSINGDRLTVNDFHDILALRTSVFVVEQNCPYQEVDGNDLLADTVHMWTNDEDGISSYLRILSCPPDRQIGRVVTRQDVRGRGVSSTLIRSALQRVGETPTILSAQSHLTSFYESFGFAINGPEFLEDGIPHILMRRVSN